MAIPVNMPKMSDTMIEGVLVAWLAEEGQSVSAGDVIAQVETDKATMDLEVYDDGVLLKRVAQEGDAIPIGGLIAVLGKTGDDISAILARSGSAVSGSGTAGPESSAQAPAAAIPAISEGAAPHSDSAPMSQPEPAQVSQPGPTRMAQPEPAPTAQPGSAAAAAPAAIGGMALASDERIKASPLARRLADEHGIALERVRGTGPEGRVIKRDIEAALTTAAGAPAVPAPVAAAAIPAPGVPAPSAPSVATAPAAAAAAASPASYEAVRLTQMRKAIARRLAESKYTAPHFYLSVDVAMEKAVSFRNQVNALSEERGLAKVSFNDLVTKACAAALRRHPWANASWMEQEGEIRLHKDIHVAVAVAIDDGLITPVIRHADRKGLTTIAEETRALAERARAKQLQPDEFSGSTFTTSNLGMFGIEEFTAIINPPNVCILAIGAIREVPVVRDGEIIPGKRMKLSLSCDHRVVDGATGSAFLSDVKSLLEEPLGFML